MNERFLFFTVKGRKVVTHEIGSEKHNSETFLRNPLNESVLDLDFPPDVTFELYFEEIVEAH